MLALNTLQLNAVFDLYMNQYIGANGPFALGKQVDQWLEAKRSNYQGHAYVEQLEKNCIYLTESAASIQTYIVRYLRTGEPKLTKDQIHEFVEFTRIVYAQGVTPQILAFIYGQSDKLLPTASGFQWDKIRFLREEADSAIYIDELEFTCKLSQANSAVSQTLLGTLLDDARYRGGCMKNVSESEVSEAVTQRANIWANISIGNIGSESKTTNPKSSSGSIAESSPKKKDWRFWK